MFRQVEVESGIRVLDGYVLVTIDPERCEPSGFALNIIDVKNVDTRPEISSNKAKLLAKEFIKSKGYGVSSIITCELIIGRPNYYWEGPKPLGEPTLMWRVKLKDAAGCLIEVWVDAHTGSIIGGTLYR